MSDDIVKALLNSLTPEQKDQLVEGLLNSNVKSDDEKKQVENVEDTDSPTQRRVKEDFTVSTGNAKPNGKEPVKFKQNQWVDYGEDPDEDFDYEKFEKMKTPRRRKPAKQVSVECHVCGKKFNTNPNLIYGEFPRCDRCTGR